MISYANCLLVGAGHLGSRYLQGLATVRQSLNISVVDSSPKALAVARQRFFDSSLTSCHNITFCLALEDLPRQFDLVIVATPAHCRTDLVSKISTGYEVKAWILEKVLAQSSQQINEIEGRLGNHPQVWVNTPRRIMSWHKKIKKQLQIQLISPLLVTKGGSNWGLACNSIHFIDLLSWWTGASVSSMDVSGLQTWAPSKRPGFQEVFGTLVVAFSDGSSLHLTCDEVNTMSQITVESVAGIWSIDESTGIAIPPFGGVISGHHSFQSALTGPLVEQILKTGQCDLPALDESASQHRILLDSLLGHWNQVMGLKDIVVPIT
jgi:predicted dehydrogenase